MLDIVRYIFFNADIINAVGETVYLLIIVTLHRKYCLNRFGNCNLREMDNDNDFTFCQVCLVFTFDMIKL